MQNHFAHQLTANGHLSQYDAYALIMEQGTGKSRPILDDWLVRIDSGRADDLVVLGPKGAYMNWLSTDEDEPGEVYKWIQPERLNSIYIAPWISGGNKTQMQALQNLLYAKGPRFLAMNIEALNRPGKAREYLMNFIRDRKVIGCI